MIGLFSRCCCCCVGGEEQRCVFRYFARLFLNHTCLIYKKTIKIGIDLFLYVFLRLRFLYVFVIPR